MVVSIDTISRKEPRLTLLWIHLSDVSRLELLFGKFRLLLHTLLIAFRQAYQFLQPLLILLALFPEIIHHQRLSPNMFVQIHQHILLQSGLAVIDTNGVVVAVEAVDKRLDGGLVEVTDVRSGLAGLVAHHERLWIYEAEGINYHFALD